MPFDIKNIQEKLHQVALDGWLLYDFRRSNDLACSFLQITHDKILTRRYFYWIPVKGLPVKIVNLIEQHNLDHLPGKKVLYQTHEEFEQALQTVLKGSKSIAMEYSPGNAIPAVSKVDAGTMDLVKQSGVNVVSSADIMQYYTSVWDTTKLKSHLAAAKVLDDTAANTWKFIAERLNKNIKLTEYDVQQFMLNEFEKNGCESTDAPICAVNAHSADPHYMPSSVNSSVIQIDDFILIDLWCKQKQAGSVYADITRVGVAASKPTDKQQEIFEIVKKARDAGTELVKRRMQKNEPLMGCEVDECCRKVIQDSGYGKYFLHRTGHNIDEQDHGNGAHLDSFETYDCRHLIPGTCFSIEPGIYLPDEFGVRLEYDVYVSPERDVLVTGGIQDSITCLF